MSTPHRQATWKKWFGVTFFVGTTQVPFWILYSQTGNIVNSMGITAVITIARAACHRQFGPASSPELIGAHTCTG
jgi:hypothetical protein